MLLHTWKSTDDEDDSPFFEEPKPEPLHNRRSMLVTGIQDLLSNADSNAFGILWVAASLLSKAAKYSLYWTRTDIDWRRRSLRSALAILGSLKWVTTKVTWWKRYTECNLRIHDKNSRLTLKQRRRHAVTQIIDLFIPKIYAWRKDFALYSRHSELPNYSAKFSDCY